MDSRLCIAACVYGRKYQGWIPIYIYSIKKNYPEYDIKIFIDKDLSLGIKRLLKKYDLYRGVDIIENIDFSREYGFKSTIEKRCFRWLVNGEPLKEYDYVYWGDVDIYIVKEDISLMKQHVDDMEISHRCYSNALRLSARDYMKRHKKSIRAHLFRLTGLHFVEAKTYYNEVASAQEMIIRYLKSGRLRFIDKLFFHDDERCLWLVHFLSRLEFPNGSYEIDEKVFRPLHGIHFALGREYAVYRKIFNEGNIHYNDHTMYFRKFREEYNADPVLRSLIYESPLYVVSIIDSMCSIWKGKLRRDGIDSRQ